MEWSDPGRRTILITGCSSGIGRATALELAARGYAVLAGVRRETDAEALRAAASEGLLPLILDVTRDDHLEGAVAAVRAATGEAGLFALVNNAGHNYCAPFEHSDEAHFRTLMETNLFGLARMSQRMIPHLRRWASVTGDTAKLVNIGSIGSHVGVPWEPWYHASKFAVLGISESIRNEVHRQGIRVSVVCPGGIRTPFIAKSGAQARETAAALPPEARALYAGSLAQFARVSGHVDSLGTSPERVARRIATLLERRNPPFNVLVGMDARLMRAMKALLPEPALHALLRRAFAR